MRDEGANEAARVFRITPWLARVLVPLIVLVVSLGLIEDHAAAAIPVPFLLGGLYMYAAERIGLYVSASGIESKMTRRANTFRYQWSEISGLSLVESRSQCAIVLVLRDGTRKLLPSTRAWAYNKPTVERICEQLTRERAAFEPGPQSGS
jgi:hypothetical protein